MQASQVLPAAQTDQTVQAQKTATALAELLFDGSSTIKKPKGTHFHPHLFITRVDSCKPIVMGEVSCSEYFGALKRMEAHPDLPQGWLPDLSSHLQKLVNMAELWE